VRAPWRLFSPLHFLNWGTCWLVLGLVAGLALGRLPLPAAGLLMGGIVVLIAVFIEPLIGLALALLASPFGALESIILGGSSVDSGQLLLALTLVAWLAHCIVRREIRLPRKGAQAGVMVALTLFIGVGALSLLNAPSLTHGFKELAKWVQMGLVAWFVANAAGRWADREARTTVVVAVVLLVGVSQALIGIWQFGLRGHGPEHFGILGRFYRAYGTFEQPNPFAGFLGLMLPLALGLGIGKLGMKSPTCSFTHLLIPLLTTIVLATAILMSWSRGGWLGAAAGLTTMLFFLPRKRWVGGVLVLVLVAAGGLALQSGLMPAEIAGRLTSFAGYVHFQDVRGVDITPANYAVLERMAHWQAALNMANEHPWLGVGMGNYEVAYANFALLNWPYPLGHAHNYYLNLLAETGLLGLAAYLGFWTAVVWLTAQVIGRASYPERGLALGLMGAWVHLSVHHLVDKLYVNNIYLHLGALLGILMLLRKLPASPQSHPGGWPHAGETLLSPRTRGELEGGHFRS